MADDNGGDKTHKPTEKKLREARKKGDIAKSKDLTGVVALLAWVGLAGLLWPVALQTLRAPLEAALRGVSDPTLATIGVVTASCGRALLSLTLMFLIPVAITGLLVEFVQAGPVFQTEKMKFKLDHLNPGQGLKRMVGIDNLVEVAKSLAKTVLLTLICWVVLTTGFSDLVKLAEGQPDQALTALGRVIQQILTGAVVVFVIVGAADAAYQKFSFTKKMRMSRRDIRQEAKDAEGDPHIRAHRRQLHQEWANRNAAESARSASVVVVNPTHLAVALLYDPIQHPAPVVSAKGDGPLAAEMRQAAEDEGVPVIRNVELAQALFRRAVLDDIIPQDMFAAVAEVILWARKMRAQSTTDPADAEDNDDHDSVGASEGGRP